MEMSLSRCKLKRSVQIRLFEFFVLEVTARSAANLLDIHPNTAALFYRKIRQVIFYLLALEAAEIFEGCLELDESYFGGIRKGKRGFAKGKNPINGIENFWSQAKRVLRKHNGINRDSFFLFLKKCEFRFNCSTPKQQLKTLRIWCDI